MAEILTLRIPDGDLSEEFDFLMTKVAEEKRRKIRSFRRREDAERSLFGEALIRAVSCAKLRTSNDLLRLAVNEYGKPFVPEAPGFHFNLSHSGRWIALIHGSAPVGIDVERMRSFDWSLARHALSRAEFEELSMQPEDALKERFYELWTLKESYIKAVGKGLSIPLDSFSIHALPDGSIQVHPDAGGYRFKLYELEPGYKLAACAGGGEPLPGSTASYELGWLLADLR